MTLGTADGQNLPVRGEPTETYRNKTEMTLRSTQTYRGAFLRSEIAEMLLKNKTDPERSVQAAGTAAGNG